MLVLQIAAGVLLGLLVFQYRRQILQFALGSLFIIAFYVGLAAFGYWVWRQDWSHVDWGSWGEWLTFGAIVVSGYLLARWSRSMSVAGTFGNACKKFGFAVGKGVKFMAARRKMATKPTPTFGHPEFSSKVHQAYPKFFEVVPRLTDSLNDLTGRAYPQPERWQRVILNLGLLTGISAWELVTLAGNGFGQGAMKIARTVLETAINAEYLRRFPTECDAYLNWHWIEQHKLLVYVQQYAPELLPQLSERESERVEREYQVVRPQFEQLNGEIRSSWCRLDLGARAARTGFAEAFRLINPISSQLIHGTFGGLSRHFDLSEDEHRISIPPSMEYVAEALIGAHTCVLKMVETLADSFGNTPCNPVSDLVKDFYYAWQREP
jgi:hypothetical protein